MNLQELTTEEQRSICNRFIVPQNIEDVYVNNHGQPYELVGCFRLALPVRKSTLTCGGFHVR